MIEIKKRFDQLFGKRLLKTAISVFITATICAWLGWPAIFAVIAAIVTIEPTVYSSIQKGKIRLPAAAIGAAFAMFFNYLLGPQPLTYALSALLTIWVCHRLHWDDAILVATLTAVNMIPLTDGDYLLNFLIRLGTTSTGIIVSTLVNFFMMPPNYMQHIAASIKKISADAKQLIGRSLDYQLKGQGCLKALQAENHRMLQALQQTAKWIEFQKAEYRFHRFKREDVKILKRMEQELELLQSISSHIANIIHIPAHFARAEETEQRILNDAWNKTALYFQLEHRAVPEDGSWFAPPIRQLMALVRQQMNLEENWPHYRAGGILAYELLMIHALLTRTVASVRQTADGRSQAQ